jgi:hypothetical protein
MAGLFFAAVIASCLRWTTTILSVALASDSLHWSGFVLHVSEGLPFGQRLSRATTFGLLQPE